jgi:hypothetical protein
MSMQIPLPAADGFERHYAEKIWALIPEVYRSEDGGPLRALVEILAAQAAIARCSVDRLWSDSRIDEADDWAVPYIEALVAARPVDPRNRAGQRATAALTIHHRRRNGTRRLAEQLAADIAGWDAVASEAFKRLARYWHMLDGGPRPGPISLTPQGGYADLRSTRVDRLSGGAHDDLAHYPEFRRHRGQLGRYNIAKLNLHLFRQRALPLTGVTPVRIAAELYTLDPSGRDVALFQVGGRSEADCRTPREWEMPAPISCRRLNFAGFRPRVEHVPAALQAALAPLYGRRFTTESAMLDAADAALAADPAPPNSLTPAQRAALIAAAMEPATPRRNLLPEGDPATVSIELAVGATSAVASLGPERVYGADLAEWGEDHAPPAWARAMVDPARGRVRLTNPLAARQALLVRRIHYGLFWPVGAGTHERAALPATGFTAVAVDQPAWTAPLAGEQRLMDSRTFTPQLAPGAVIEANGDLMLSAGDGARPYVLLAADAGGTVTIRTTTAGATLVIDGLWIGIDTGGAAGPATLRIEGAWKQVILRNVTLDPGGERAAAPAAAPAPIAAVRLALAGAIDDVRIERCVTGPVTEVAGPLDPGATDTVTIVDSILRSPGGEPAVALRNASLAIDATTVFGDVVAGRIDASELLVDGLVLAEDRQAGCFRFSAAAAGSLAPHPYLSHFFDPRLPAGAFVSRRFGDAGYAQLAETAPIELREGGEGGVEIGAFKAALDPVKRADLAAKLREFMPINAIAQMIIET